MIDTENYYNGMRIVPHKDENGVAFAGFEGLVICSTKGYSFIEIYKTAWESSGFYIKSSIVVPFEETLAHSSESGIKKLNFLCSKAKELQKENEEIAICDELAVHLRLMDASWNDVQRLLAERK